MGTTRRSDSERFQFATMPVETQMELTESGSVRRPPPARFRLSSLPKNSRPSSSPSSSR